MVLVDIDNRYSDMGWACLHDTGFKIKVCEPRDFAKIERNLVRV